jgi:hypothetical protein
VRRYLDGDDHQAGLLTSEHSRSSLWLAIVKNVFACGVAGGIWFALQTGYVSPDRPTRPQWERIERAKEAPGGVLAYQSNFQRDMLTTNAGAPPSWSRYNGATANHVKFDSGGVTVDYSGIAWIGARLSFPNYEPGATYRLTIAATVDTEPGAILVRNRQLDLIRTTVPVGSGTTRTHFVAPPGRLDQVVIAFIADGRSEPKGSMHITSVAIERMEERVAGRTE